LSTGTSSVKDSWGTAVFGALGTLRGRRWLIWYFVQRELSKTYRGSLLGFAWAFLTPLLMIFLYTLVFSQILGLRFREVEGDSAVNFGIYLYCGLLPFLTFSQSLTKSTNSIKSNSALISKTAFPPEILPLATALTAMVDKLFGLGVLILVVAVLGYGAEWTLLLLPVILVSQLIFTLGLGYVFSVLGAYLPDVKETLQSVVRAMFFVTPIIWPASRVEGTNLQFVVDYNPLAFLVESYRAVILDGVVPDVSSLLIFTLFSAALLVCGFALFVRAKRRFVDLI
jgi:ABC-type polysaccharide/polyol phosphate export permease